MEMSKKQSKAIKVIKEAPLDKKRVVAKKYNLTI